MKFERQDSTDLYNSLSPLEVDWKDETARAVIKRLESFPEKAGYSREDVIDLLNEDFNTGILLVRLFLGMSKDTMEGELRAALGSGGIGVTRFSNDPARFSDVLVQFGLLDAIVGEVHKNVAWYDPMIERLRSGRGSAVSGQKRGRMVEDLVEKIVHEVFDDSYNSRCNFEGQRGRVSKCDFAIPNKESPSILIEAKGYGATGSKMTDVIGDIEKIIAAKRSDTIFMLFTDGMTWLQRKSDFEKIIEYQNHGDIARIYTTKLTDAFRSDLETLRSELSL